MDLKEIKELNQKCQAQKKDLYSFLEEEFPDMAIEKRLEVMANVLNEHLEDYTYNQADKLKKEGYAITKFYPKR